jgi:hypothetical protein
LHLSGQAFPPPPSDILFRKEIILKLGGFDEVFNVVSGMCEDLAFLAKVYSNLPVFVSDVCWDRYRLHSDSLCARVKKAGRDQAARAFYLNWLIQYLSTQGIFEGDIRQSVYRDLWRTRHPKLHRLSRLGPGIVRRTKDMGAKLFHR